MIRPNKIHDGQTICIRFCRNSTELTGIYRHISGSRSFCFNYKIATRPQSRHFHRNLWEVVEA